MTNLSTLTASSITKGPTRLFIQDALIDESIQHRSVEDVSHFPQEVDWFREAHTMVRLMGIVVHVSDGVNQQSNWEIDIDDGSSSLRVFIHASDLGQKQQQALKLGILVDCLGFLISPEPQRPETKDETHLKEEPTSTPSLLLRSSEVFLLARSISCIQDPNIEQLRTLEILQDHKNKTSTNKLVTNVFYDNVIMAGSPTLTTGTFSVVLSSQHESPTMDCGETDLPPYRVVINKDHVLQIIQSLSQNGGINEQDLALVLGIVGGTDVHCGSRYTLPKENAVPSTNTKLGLQALREVLGELHKDGMIYMRPGDVYFPL